MSDSPRVSMIKKLKRRIKDYLDKCSVEELIFLADRMRIKVPNQLRGSVSNKNE